VSFAEYFLVKKKQENTLQGTYNRFCLNDKSVSVSSDALLSFFISRPYLKLCHAEGVDSYWFPHLLLLGQPSWLYFEKSLNAGEWISSDV